MKNINNGAYVTMITPYDDKGNVDYGAVNALAEWYCYNNIDGIFASCQSSEIQRLGNYNDLLKIIEHYDLVLFAHTLYKDQVNLFNELQNNKAKNVLVIVGPEGGFDDKEVEKLIAFNNLKPISLGKRILRTETAPLYIMSVLGFIGEQYEN